MAIIPILAMVVVLVAAGSAALLTGHTSMKGIKLNERAIKALEIAEAGIGFSVQELDLNQDLNQDGVVGNVGGTFGDGAYDVTATDVGDGQFELRSRGLVQGVPRILEIVVGGTRGKRYYPNGLVGRAAVELTSNVELDSYDSLSSYLSQLVNSDHKGKYASDSAAVVSNGGITAGATVVVRGSVSPGPGEFFNSHPKTYLSGSEEPLQDKAPIADPPKKQFEWALNNNLNGKWKTTGGNATYDSKTMALLVDGKTKLEFLPGVYFFTSLTLAGKSGIKVTGATKIFVTGNVDLAGGSVVNTTGRPSDFEVIAHPYAVGGFPVPTDPEFQLAGGAQVAMAIYAPDYKVLANGSGSFFGAIVGNNLMLQGIDMHYDETLAKDGTAEMDGMPTDFVRRSWKDSSTVGY